MLNIAQALAHQMARAAQTYLCTMFGPMVVRYLASAFLALLVCALLPKDALHLCAHDHKAEHHETEHGAAFEGMDGCALCEVLVPSFLKSHIVPMALLCFDGSDLFIPSAVGLPVVDEDASGGRGPPLRF